MRKNHLGKFLALGIIVLSFGVSVSSAISIENKPRISINESEEYRECNEINDDSLLKNKWLINGLKEMEIKFSEPQINYNGKYTEISLKETDSNIMYPGKPILPKYNKIITFPLGTKIKNIEVTLSETKQLTLSKSMPTAPYPCVGQGNIGLIKNLFNGFLYRISSVYPKEWFDYETGGGLDGDERVTFLSIQLHPVKYFTKSNKIEYAEKMKIKIEYVLPENPQNFPDVYDFLILAPSEYITYLSPLVEHKNNHSISTKLVTLEEIDGNGRDKQEQIKYFIKDSIENWGIKYVLLVGDKTRMPVRYTSPMAVYGEHFFGEIPTDLYYADIYDSDGKFCSWDSNNDNKFGRNTFFYSDKVDLYPDVAIGRLYCNSYSEVVDVVNKIISYEDEIYGQDWPNNIAICGGNTHFNWKDIFFLNFPYFRIILGSGKIANEGEYIGNKISDILTNFNLEKYYASSTHPDNKLTCDNINNAINDGAGFVFFLGHGNTETWVTYTPSFFRSNSKIMPAPEGYKIDHINALNNENKYPIIIITACSTGDFRETDSPIAWQAVKLKSKGAIATFASTGLSLGFPGTYIEKGFSGLINLGIAKAIADGTEYVGDLLKSSINNYLNNAANLYLLNFINLYILQIQELFGDPTLKIGGYR